MATWRVWGERFETADASGTRIHQPVIFHQNAVLFASRAWYIFYNNSSWDNLVMKFYSDDNGSPGQLVGTSTNSWVANEIYTLDYAAKEIYFEWANPVFKDEDTFHFVTHIDNYIGSSSSHVSWKKTFPDPPYKTGLTLTFEKLLTYPYDLTFILNVFK